MFDWAKIYIYCLSFLKKCATFLHFKTNNYYFLCITSFFSVVKIHIKFVCSTKLSIKLLTFPNSYFSYCHHGICSKIGFASWIIQKSLHLHKPLVSRVDDTIRQISRRQIFIALWNVLFLHRLISFILLEACHSF